MIILAAFGPDVQLYQRQFGQLVFPRPKTCPRCDAADHLIGHGSYPRSVCDHNEALAIRVKRFLCTMCRHTISLLPSFCLPYRHYLAGVIQRVLDLRFQKQASWAIIRRHFAPCELPVLSTCRAWVHTFACSAEQASEAPPAIGDLAAAARQAGTAPRRVGRFGRGAGAATRRSAPPRSVAARERLRAARRGRPLAARLNALGAIRQAR